MARKKKPIRKATAAKANQKALVRAKSSATKKKAVGKKKVVATRKAGRPTSYKNDYAELAQKLCLLGLTDIEMADFFEVAESTIYLWKKKVPEFSEALIVGKTIADANVANSLYRRACGYEHPEIHVSNYQGKIKLTEITKKYPPDTGAIIMWLKNRQPDIWRDVKDWNIGGQRDNPLVILARAVQGAPLLPNKQKSTGAQDAKTSKK